MNKQKVTAILVTLSVSIISMSIMTILLMNYHNRSQFQTLGSICQEIMEKQPEAAQTVLEVLKKYNNSAAVEADDNILRILGYQPYDFQKATQKYSIVFAGIGFLIGGLIVVFSFWYFHRKEVLRIQALTEYLEKVNMGNVGLLMEDSEDVFSKLKDEIYKTVTSLCQTRDDALEARNNFAQNLSNIAHQLKTPITAISLSTQMMKEYPSKEYPEQIKKQLSRLVHLEEALLLLSRIDAGTLSLERNAVDVFTLLTLASDNLQEMCLQSGIVIDVKERGAIEIIADLDWTMEAIMNLLKNCMEHTPIGKMVCCSYEQNPLYTQIYIYDEGEGFSKEDLPHLFERFYRGQNAKDGGIGIGLSLAQAIIEMQNGIIRAGNIQNGGAYFEIRIYRH